MDRKKFQIVDEYISALPEPAMTLMLQMRRTIKKAAPAAEEVISYNIPAFRQDGMLVWYAAFKKHIGFYPRMSAIGEFHNELLSYKCSKGAIQFPIDKPLPLGLITKMVKFRIKENRLEQEIRQFKKR